MFYLVLYDNNVSKMQFLCQKCFPKVPSRKAKWGKVKDIEISKCFKVSVVGTLNFCLEMPDLMEKV